MSTIKQIIEEYNKDEMLMIATHDKLLSVLSKFEGKPITKRLETELKKHFSDIWLEKRYSSQNLSIKVEGRADRVSFYLPHNNIYTAEEFKRLNLWAGEAALERIAKNNNFLATKAASVAKALDKVKKAIEELNSLEFESYQCPAYYDILRDNDLMDLNKLLR